MCVWNREYVVHDVTEGEGWLCLAGFVYRFFPWALVHFIDSLVKMKGTDAPRRLRAEWQAEDATWSPPPK